jgi:hypothetical protein
METQIINATEYRNVSLALLNESKTNPRRVFDDAPLRELAESIRSHGVLSPLLVRPLTEHGFEIVAGARRFRAAQIAEADTVPVRIVELTDAQGTGGATHREPATAGRSSDGRGAGLPRLAQSGGAAVHRRADRGEDG